VLIGLVHGFGQISNTSGDEYIFVGPWRGGEWLLPHLPSGIQYVTPPPPRGQFFEDMKDFLGPLRRPLGVIRRAMTRPQKADSPPELPFSDGFYESLGPDVLHITYPLKFVRASLPTIVTMHDLQHRHFPEFFGPGVMQWREATYPRMFERSDAVITVSKFCKDDIVRQYGVPPSKIYAIPLAAPIEAYRRLPGEARQALISKYRLPRDFMLYPALTYRHKNHVGLLRALALLRRQGVQTTLVCTGAKRLHWAAIERKIRDLQLQDSVRFLGFVPTSDLAGLYDTAQFVILPSLFEGAGLPLLEAFKAGKPVACSDIAAFREYGGDAPLFFDPGEPDSIAEAIEAIAGDADLRAKLASQAARRGSQFSWRRTAELHQAVYRRVAGQQLSSKQKRLLEAA
jgi:glycosyltransferase involved in cell wall biosynthesis